METRASKTMLKYNIILWSLSEADHFVKAGHLVITYSEAMLISGASKQISCAILYNYIFVFLVKK